MLKLKNIPPFFAIFNFLKAKFLSDRPHSAVIVDVSGTKFPINSAINCIDSRDGNARSIKYTELRPKDQTSALQAL